MKIHTSNFASHFIASKAVKLFEDNFYSHFYCDQSREDVILFQVLGIRMDRTETVIASVQQGDMA